MAVPPPDGLRQEGNLGHYGTRRQDNIDADQHANISSPTIARLATHYDSFITRTNQPGAEEIENMAIQ